MIDLNEEHPSSTTSKLISTKRLTWPTLIIGWAVGFKIIEWPENHPRRAMSFLYMASLLGLYLYSYAYANDMSYKYLRYRMKSLSLLVMNTTFYGNGAFTIWVIVYNWIHQKSNDTWYCQLDELRLKIEQMGYYEDHHLFKKRQIAVIIFVLIINIGTIAFGFTLFIKFPLPLTFMALYLYYYPLIILCVSNMSFFNNVSYIRTKFVELNNRLSAMLKTQKSVRWHITAESTIRSSQQYLKSIRNSRIVHLKLVRILSCLRKAYEVQILLSTVVSLIVITGCCYGLYMELISEPLTKFAIVKMFVIGFYTINIITINWVCSYTAVEAHKTGRIISKLYESTRNTEIRAEIRHFTIQLIQNPLSLTVCGFFTLGRVFISTMIGSVTTYLVILIQLGDKN